MTHQEAVAEPTDAAEVGVELELERAPEHVDPGVASTASRPASRSSAASIFSAACSLDLGPRRPAALRCQVVAHEPFGPGGEVAPAGGRVDVEVVDERGDELLEAARRRELGLELLGMRFALGDGELGGELELLTCGRSGRGVAATGRRRARSRRRG